MGARFLILFSGNGVSSLAVGAHVRHVDTSKALCALFLSREKRKYEKEAKFTYCSLVLLL